MNKGAAIPLPFFMVRSKLPAYINSAVNLEKHDGIEVRGSGDVEEENGELFVELRREQIARVRIPPLPDGITERTAGPWYESVVEVLNNKMIELGWGPP